MQHVAPVIFDKDAENGEKRLAEAVEVRQVTGAGLLVQRLELGLAFTVYGLGRRA